MWSTVEKISSETPDPRQNSEYSAREKGWNYVGHKEENLKDCFKGEPITYMYRGPGMSPLEQQDPGGGLCLPRSRKSLQCLS